MPTVKPRITITLSESQYAVLSELSKLQKASMSSIVVDLIDSTLPVLERLAALLSTAAIASESVHREIRKSVELAESDTIDMSDFTQISGLLEQLVVRASADPSTATGGRREGSAEVGPPTSNRGVRIAPQLVKNDSISPMKKGEKNGRAEK